MMKYLILFFAWNAFASTPDCPYNFDGVQGVLDLRSRVFKEITEPQKDVEKKALVESAVFRDGTKVTYEAGGCAHMSYSFKFENLKRTGDTKEELLIIARRLLNRTPTVKTDKNRKILLEALRKVQSKGLSKDRPLKLPCGDAECFLEAQDKSSLRVTYSFAL